MSAAIDLGPVRYEPPLTRSSAWHAPGHGSKPLRTGPRWLRGATRWHRIRSGVQYEHLDHPSYSAWCGQSINPEGREAAVNEPTDGLPLCGTCEGRAAGAGHPSPLGLPESGLLFRPARLDPPRWCPGGGPYGPAMHLGEVVGHRVVRCGACGELARERNAYGWNPRPGGEPQQHEPGPGLVPGCPMHAWRHLIRTAEGVACECAGIEREEGAA